MPYSILNLLAVVLVLMGLGNEIRAGKYNSKMNPGDAAPQYSQLPGVDGKKHSFVDIATAKAKVIVFTCNSCPYSVDYEDRLNAFCKKYGQNPDVVLVAINSNLTAADSLEKMKIRAKEKSFQFPYLLDKSQKLARDFGALRTPEVYVLNAKNQIVYMGAFDDNAKIKQVKTKHVENAVQAILEGKEVEIEQTPPIGCLIRFKRSRQGR